MSNNIHFSLDTLNDGAVLEQVMKQIQRVADDIFDPNTENKAKRTVTLKLTLSGSEDLKTIDLSTQVTAKLAPSTKAATTLLGGLNASGEAELSELKSSAPGQMMIDTETGDTVLDTGMPIAGGENPEAVIDMRTGRPVED